MTEDGKSSSTSLRRRRFVQAVGISGVAGLAGCTTGGDGGGGGGDGGGTPTPSDGGDGGGDGGDGGGGGTETPSDGGSTDGGSGKIVMGQPALLSGPLTFIQPPVSASADIAVRNINEAGGPLGREVEIVRRDTGQQPQTAREVQRQFVNVDKAATIHGYTSTVAVPLFDFFQETAHPIISMYSGTRFYDSHGGDGGTPGDLSDDQWYWRTTGADSQHTGAAALHAKREGATKIGAINTKAAGPRTWAKAFLDGARALDGLEVVKRTEVDGGQSSYRSDLEQFFSEDMDLFGVAGGVPTVATVLSQWGEGGYGGKAMVANSLKNPGLVDEIGSQYADSFVRTAVPAIAGPYADQYLSKLNSFVKESNNYKDDLTANNWAGASWDSFNIGALAIHAAGETTPAEIQKNIGRVARPPGKKVKTFAEGKKALDNGEEINYQGAQTTCNFNKFGDVFNLVRVFQIQSDGWKQVDEITESEVQNIVDAVRQLDS